MKAQVPEKATPVTTMPTEIVLPMAQTGPGTATRDGEHPITYYNHPMLRKPTWKWPIPFYFFLGGVAGGAAVIGAAAEILGGDNHKSTVRHARWLALILAMICPLLLIQDLGRPARFYRMLRIFKVSSPLNVGTWILSAFGLLSGILGAKQAAEDDMLIRRESGLGRFLRAIPSGPFTALHGLAGLGLGGYTGVVLTATAVPLWAAGGILLGPLFLATAIASGAAALTLIGIFRGNRTDEARRRVQAVETVATMTQLGLLAARQAVVPSTINKPLRRGVWGAVWQAGAVGGGVAAPLAIRLAVKLSGRRTSETLAAVSSALSLLGALAERMSLVEAGKLSADDPIAYQELTKGAPGQARSTPAEQAQRAPKTPAYKSGFVAPERTGPTR
ncbi:MAG: NrfD/PsrC family molybdoenzyme membrane anchor subunit [Ktedonobacterales bacterium]